MILKRTSFAVAVAVLILGTAAALSYAQGLDLTTKQHGSVQGLAA